MAARPAPFVDAPVLGHEGAGRAGRADVLASGRRGASAARRCSTRSAAQVVDLGDEPGAGTRMKLV
jgi:3-hydroxyisobutyrate dehydrogenase-like beta-hydroxyacid dehydrogenase